jgi:hypothetical protein
MYWISLLLRLMLFFPKIAQTGRLVLSVGAS